MRPPYIPAPFIIGADARGVVASGGGVGGTGTTIGDSGANNGLRGVEGLVDDVEIVSI